MTVSDKPKPRTAEEIAALPIGPAFGVEERVIDGRTVRVPVFHGSVCVYHDEKDPIGYCDSDGVLWLLRCYADGTWFRQRASA